MTTNSIATVQPKDSIPKESEPLPEDKWDLIPKDFQKNKSITGKTKKDVKRIAENIEQQI